MSESIIVSGETKKEKYESLLPQIKALVECETDWLANISNIVAALKFGMDFFWAGVYFVKPSSSEATNRNSKQLVLGAFQGPVACTRINYGKGVCGKCWEIKETIIVDDVDKFPGHIACSNLSRSEIVLPGINKTGEVIFIIDVDSTVVADFDETDKKYLQQVVEIMNEFIF